MNYIVEPDDLNPPHPTFGLSWQVRASENGSGYFFIADFGYDTADHPARERALEYARWKNGGGEA